MSAPNVLPISTGSAILRITSRRFLVLGAKVKLVSKGGERCRTGGGTKETNRSSSITDNIDILYTRPHLWAPVIEIGDYLGRRPPTVLLE
jgi:hypothetical protein